MGVGEGVKEDEILEEGSLWGVFTGQRGGKDVNKGNKPWPGTIQISPFFIFFLIICVILLTYFQKKTLFRFLHGIFMLQWKMALRKLLTISTQVRIALWLLPLTPTPIPLTHTHIPTPPPGTVHKR